MTIHKCKRRKCDAAKANGEFNLLIRWLKPTAIDIQSQGRGYLLPSASADGKVRQWQKGFSHIFYLYTPPESAFLLPVLL